MIAAERSRQIEEEGWSPEHDDEHLEGELGLAAMAYIAASDRYNDLAGERFYPSNWKPGWWKPSEDRIRNLVKAGALIAAEIDRLKRLYP